MAAQVNFVSEINSKSMNYKLKVRVVRLWENPDRDRPDTPFSIEIILMDEKGDRIHASIGMSFIQRFNQQIKEMGLYIMKNFVVCPNNMKLKTKDYKFKLMFTHKTTVEEIYDPHFNMCIFKFKTYDQLSNPLKFNNTELFDVIGEIVSYEDVQSIKQDDSIRMFMNIEIQDYESNNISATPWGEFVEQIKPHLNGSNDKPVVIVMQLISTSI